MKDRKFFFLILFFLLTTLLLVLRFTGFSFVSFDKGKVAQNDYAVSRDIELVIDSQVVSLQKGQTLVRKGDIVGDNVWRLISELEKKDQRELWSEVSGSVLLSLFLLALFGIFAQREPYNLWSDESMIYLVVLFYGLGLGLFFGFRHISDPNMIFLLNPIPLLVLMYAVFFSRDLAFAMTVIFSTIFSFIAPSDISDKVFFISLLGSLLGVFSVSSQQSRRADITKAGLLVGIANFLLLLGLNLTHVKMMGQITFQSMYQQPVLGFVNGLLCAIFALGAIPIIEVFFRITTSTRLLELIQPTQPLLQKLLKEAPGTYHHSMLVADLAEKAAESIGADSLLAKCSAFYHDVGKIKRPFFFAENQLGGVNFHDNLQPSLSSLIITSHTHDGVEIGKEYNLPKVILDIMVQHHGTDLVAFFHNKAKQNETDTDTVSEETFRYDGVKPQTKEAGIIMISDAVEAASRTLMKPTPASIESLIRRIIDRKDEDAQFDECDLTKKELDQIAVTLTKSLVSMFHARIKYPDEVLETRKAAAQK